MNNESSCSRVFSTCCKNHINTPTTLSEPTLRLWQETFSYGLKPFLYHSCEYFANSIKKTDATPVVTGWLLFFGIGTISASFHSLMTFFPSHTYSINSCILSHNSAPPYTTSSGLIPVFPPAFPFLSLPSANSSSSTVGGLSKSHLVGCGVMLSITCSQNLLGIFGIFKKCLYRYDLAFSALVVSSPVSFSMAVCLLGLHPA